MEMIYLVLDYTGTEDIVIQAFYSKRDAEDFADEEYSYWVKSVYIE